MGGDTIGGWIDYIIEWLKSTPPAWAGTRPTDAKPAEVIRLNPPRPHGRGLFKLRMTKSRLLKLKSTPPAWAGTPFALASLDGWMLKSTPPAWAGTLLWSHSLRIR